MRHRKNTAKLGRKSSHREAFITNMMTSLFRHERIRTTLDKAKEARRFAEKTITMAKKNTLHARRLVNKRIKDEEVLSKLFSVIGPRFAARNGGYTRIINTHHRLGDGASMVYLELLDRIAPVVSKKEKKKSEKEEVKPAAESTIETKAEVESDTKAPPEKKSKSAAKSKKVKKDKKEK
jgi:large subunit ribosomal protein L17